MDLDVSGMVHWMSSRFFWDVGVVTSKWRVLIKPSLNLFMYSRGGLCGSSSDRVDI